MLKITNVIRFLPRKVGIFPADEPTPMHDHVVDSPLLGHSFDTLGQKAVTILRTCEPHQDLTIGAGSIHDSIRTI